MKRFLMLLGLVTVLVAGAGLAKPTQEMTVPQITDNPAPRLAFPNAMAKSAVDTTYLLGGPDRWDGSFDTPGGQPDWHGWTHEDASLPLDNNWHVSNYYAEYIPGHGLGNHAMYCGDETMPECGTAIPDTIGGYGNNWLDEIEWRQAVADPSQAVTVRLTGAMLYDTEDGYDIVQLLIQRGETTEILDSWSGEDTAALDYTTVLSPGEFTGPGLDEVRLIWRFKSDGAWSDEGCIYPSHGACQIDDLSVYLDGNLITFDDFEPGSPVNWSEGPVLVAGDFSNLRNNLPSVHPCQSVNQSYQANFIDDGVVVPGTGGTPCITWCYGPGGYIINNSGGLTNDSDFHIINRVISPPLAWPAGTDAAELAFDAYVHEFFFSTNVSGIFPFWWVRSTASSDPADLQEAPWVDRGLGLTNAQGSYERQIHEISDMMVPGRQWAQVALGIYEFGFAHGFDGPDGTPAPYFDNVAFKIWDPVGPDIFIKPENVFGDATAEAGVLDPVDLAANSCRIDRVFGLEARGDSLIAFVTPLRHGATVVDPPTLHWVLKSNPVFDPVRISTPDAQGVVRASVSGIMHSSPSQDWWSFDLPDTGLFYPGDVLRYYLTASDDLAGDIRTSVWPPDTTGVLDFSPGEPYPLQAEIRGLPTLTQPVPDQFAHPQVLYIDDSGGDAETRTSWLAALDDLGYMQGNNLDILTLHYPGDLDFFTTAEVIAGYTTMIYSSGPSFTSLGREGPAVLIDWLESSGKNGLFAGQRLVSRMGSREVGVDLQFSLGVHSESSSVTGLNGGIWDLLVSPIPGNGILPDDVSWQINAACPKIRLIDALGTVVSGQSAADLDAAGSSGSLYSATVTVDDLALGNRTVVVPFDLDSISGITVGSGKRDKAFSPSTYLVYYLMSWLGADVVSGIDDVPGVGQVTVAAHPNPFNPSTTIAFELPRAAEVSLDIYDLQGRLVRRLLDESPYVSGVHKQVWDGRDGDGRATSSGVYFYRFTTGDQKRVGKLTLLK